MYKSQIEAREKLGQQTKGGCTSLFPNREIGKAADFYSAMRRFESSRPSQFLSN
jgi:hypothetical protein